MFLHCLLIPKPGTPLFSHHYLSDSKYEKRLFAFTLLPGIWVAQISNTEPMKFFFNIMGQTWTSAISSVTLNNSTTILVLSCSTSQTWKKWRILSNSYLGWSPLSFCLNICCGCCYCHFWPPPNYFFISPLRIFFCSIVFLYLNWS